MKARVMAKALRLREFPEGAVITQLMQGDVVDVENWDYSSQWAAVCHQGKHGYVVKEYMEQIAEDGTAVPSASADPSLSAPFTDRWSYSSASGYDRPYVVFQVTLKEKFLGTASRNLTELEDVLNHFAARGYRLHTMATSESGSKGGLLGDRIQATLVFEKIQK